MIDSFTYIRQRAGQAPQTFELDSNQFDLLIFLSQHGIRKGFPAGLYPGSENVEEEFAVLREMGIVAINDQKEITFCDISMVVALMKYRVVNIPYTEEEEEVEKPRGILEIVNYLKKDFGNEKGLRQFNIEIPTVPSARESETRFTSREKTYQTAIENEIKRSAGSSLTPNL